MNKRRAMHAFFMQINIKKWQNFAVKKRARAPAILRIAGVEAT